MRSNLSSRVGFTSGLNYDYVRQPGGNYAARLRLWPDKAIQLRFTALRRQQLREDARRPGGELLEQAMRLSRFATELAAAGRRARR